MTVGHGNGNGDGHDGGPAQPVVYAASGPGHNGPQQAPPGHTQEP